MRKSAFVIIAAVATLVWSCGPSPVLAHGGGHGGGGHAGGFSGGHAGGFSGGHAGGFSGGHAGGFSGGHVGGFDRGHGGGNFGGGTAGSFSHHGGGANFGSGMSGSNDRGPQFHSGSIGHQGNWYPNSRYRYYSGNGYGHGNGSYRNGSYWNSWSFYPWIGGAYLGSPIYGWYGPGYGLGYYGYYGYGNTLQPYTTARPTTSAQLIQPSTTAVSTEGEEFERLANEAFRSGDLDQAARYAMHALVETPDNGQLHQLAAQAMFAVGDYAGSAGLLHQSASMQDEKDWGYVITNYKNYYHGDEYVQQMKQLDAHLRDNPKDSAAFFVRGYNYGFLRYDHAAVKDLTKAYELEPRDKLAAHLIERFGGQVPTVSTETNDQAQTSAPNPGDTAPATAQTSEQPGTNEESNAEAEPEGAKEEPATNHLPEPATPQ